MLPQLLSASLRKTGEEKTACILVATSGDTGKAALEGFADVPQTKIMVFYPRDGVSEIQKLQMVTQEGANVGVCSVVGNFDDAQNGVKRIFSDVEIREELNKRGYFLSSANSINWGRILPQVVYYVSAYCDLMNEGAIAFGDKVNYCVPTGNFGNILACYYAKKMGIPVGKLICASNCNNVLTDFIRTGIYDRNRAFHLTTSPSMDILISSNLERLLYEAADRDGALIRVWMNQLKECGSYSVGEQRRDWIGDVFWGDCADNKDTLQEIRKQFDENHYLMDPHTAVASHVLRQYRLQRNDPTLTIVLSTASPYKFAADVLRGVAGEDAVKDLDPFACSEELERITGMPMPKQVRELRDLPVRHTAVCERDAMGPAVISEFD